MQLKTVEDMNKEFIKWHSAETTFAYGVPGDGTVSSWWLDTITQDRADIRAVLREQILDLMQDEHPTEDGVPVETYGYEETHNQALKQVLTLIDTLLAKQ